MSSYINKLQRVEDAIIRECKKKITNKFNEGYFEMWMSIDAPCELPHIYKSEFKNEFGDLVDENTSLYTQSCGSNLVYHVDTITSIQKNLSLNKILQYIETFIKAQLNDFSNACDHIQMSMTDDNGNDEVVVNNPEDNNPSNT
jgi:hypothetical protein